MSISYPSLQWNWITNSLRYLPSDIGQQFDLARDVYFVTIGALAWDILTTLPDDITLLQSEFRPVLISYFASRICALGYIVQLIVVNIYPVSHCIAIGYATTICWAVASMSGAALLFQRVKTVYTNSKVIQWAFFILLMSTISICLLVPLPTRFKELPITRYCADRGFTGFAAAALVGRLVYSSGVFLAICIRVVTMKGVSGEPTSWRTFLSSSRIVRALFRSGQQYYLISIFFNVLVVLLTFIPSRYVPTTYKIMFTAPDIALSASMASRVFRNLKITTDKIDSAMSELVSSTGNVNTGTSTVITTGTGTGTTATGNNSKHRQSLGFAVSSGSPSLDVGAGLGLGLGSGSGLGLGLGLGLGGGPMGQSRASLSMISLRERLNSNASLVNLPPVPPLPASHVYAAPPQPHGGVYGHHGHGHGQGQGKGHLRSLSATSLSRLREEDKGERYSILKVKPMVDSTTHTNGPTSTKESN